MCDLCVGVAARVTVSSSWRYRVSSATGRPGGVTTLTGWDSELDVRLCVSVWQHVPPSEVPSLACPSVLLGR